MGWKHEDMKNRPASECKPEDGVTADLGNISLETPLHYFNRYLSEQNL